MSLSFVVDVDWIERLAAAHRDSGLGAVILHGAVHSYRRSESKAWGELMGAFSMRHDAQRPLTVETVAPEHPIMRGVPEKWATIPEELGHNTAMIADPVYRGLVTRGLLWTVDRLRNDGTPAAGYAAR